MVDALRRGRFAALSFWALPREGVGAADLGGEGVKSGWLGADVRCFIGGI